MFHAELRMGMHVVRRFNLGDAELWHGFLEPLLAGEEFSVEGHEFTPRETQLTVYEGAVLRTDQLALGRGWQNAERTAKDVTARVLAAAREHARARVAAPFAGDERGQRERLRERLLGRLSAGPTAAPDILALAGELLPDGSPAACRELSAQVVWQLLVSGVAELSPVASADAAAVRPQRSGR